MECCTRGRSSPSFIYSYINITFYLKNISLNNWIWWSLRAIMISLSLTRSFAERCFFQFFLQNLSMNFYRLNRLVDPTWLNWNHWFINVESYVNLVIKLAYYFKYIILYQLFWSNNLFLINYINFLLKFTYLILLSFFNKLPFKIIIYFLAS